ncbi:glycoside hydrolase family 3 N-terminal domain-containing protein [Pseudomonas fluorescens]|uniref:glycoside hydrolase family 3 N-terminal domain-containing protein n=1 Tax=Pseudomonas fluorescens TaxID=294 RepID=UPI002ACAF2C8|nr:glycoside hydrolase family 3 N-terminal domain-containing protein [Pseudomonas fluorescens]MDZ5433679.1 glycoside hydrolase family 3 N-terminal domain-containing protein [Pseudomonas fluorescens]
MSSILPNLSDIRTLDICRYITFAIIASSPPMEAGQVHSATDPVGADRVEHLLRQMTPEEKAGQLTLWPRYNKSNPIRNNKGDDDYVPPETGAVIGTYGAEATRQLQDRIIKESRLHIPLLFSYDMVHGFRTVFPIPLAEAASWDPDLAQRTTRAAAAEATASGLRWTLAPMVDIARDPRWGRVTEGAGEDPFLASALAAARIRGLHGLDEESAPMMLATAKHFVAYGAAEGGRDYNTVDISERTLHETYLPPFRAAVEAGVDAIMAGFNEISGTPMHASQPLIEGVLRRQWGFDGIVISDYTGVVELMEHGAAALPATAVQLAMKATVDVDLAGGIFAKNLPMLIKNGEVSQRSLDDAVRRILQAKQKLGLFDDPFRYIDPAPEQAPTITPDNRALARAAAQKSIVLLKNEGGLLPLSKNIQRLVVVGALATDSTSSLGSFPGIGRVDETITVLEGIERAVSPDTYLVYVSGASPDSNDISGIDKAVIAAQAADVTIAVLGESSDMSGEANSRAFLGLAGAQETLLTRLIETGKPLVVILMNGRPLTVPTLDEQVPAILEAWFLGSEMGNGVADVLFGDVNPSGKLPVTFPRSVGQVPIYYGHKKTGRAPRADSFFTSKYIDQPWTPLYPFGFGLSYTTFAYDKPKLSKTELTSSETLSIDVTVHNTGQREGEEVVQLYLRDDVASVTRPVRSLRGFTRVSLQPGEAGTVRFMLDKEDFALLDKDFVRVIEPGTFTVFAGGSSTTENQARFKVKTGERLQGFGSAIPRLPLVFSTKDERLVSGED